MTQELAGHIPDVTLGWRLRMSLGDIKVQDMADYLDVSRQTLTRWMHDNGARPKRSYLTLWAMRTGVPLVWLEHGQIPDDGNDGDDGLPRLDSNQQPFGYRPKRRDLQGLGVIVPLLVA